MDESSKLLLTVAIPTLTVLMGILVNNRQLDQVYRRIDALDKKIDQVDAHILGIMEARFDAAYQQLLRVEGVLDARLKHLEER